MRMNLPPTSRTANLEIAFAHHINVWTLYLSQSSVAQSRPDMDRQRVFAQREYGIRKVWIGKPRPATPFHRIKFIGRIYLEA